MSRDGTFSKDSHMVNCYAEIAGDQAAAVKRPGVLEAYDLSSGDGQGMVCWQGTLYAVKGNTVSQGPTASPVPNGAVWTQSSAAATGTARAGHRMVVFNSKIWVMGGASSLGGTLLTDVWNSTDGFTWALVTASNFPTRTNFGIAALGSKIYVYGGSNGAGSYYNSVYSTTDGVTWTLETASPGWTAREKFGHCAFDSKIWAIGGFGGDAVNDVWYSANGSSWTQATASAAFSARFGMGIAVHAGQMFLVAGMNGASTLQKDVYKSSDGATWSLVTSDTGFSARREFGCVSLGNSIYVFGGDDGSANKNDVYKSNLAGTTWTQSTSSAQWSGRGYFGNGVTFNDTLFLYGGYRFSGSASYLDDVWEATINAPGGDTYTLSGTELPIQFTNTSGAAGTEYLVIKNTAKAWVLTFGTPGTLTQITDADYPATTVPGVVYLDGYFVVMDADGTIYNSDLENPTSWNSLNYTSAETEPDVGIAIAKHQNYIVAFKDRTIEMFYDAANASGSPFSVMSNTAMQLGCANGYSIASVDGGLFFMSKTRSENRSIHYFPPDGMSPVEIADENVQRVLNSATLTTVRAWAGRLSGHAFYVLNLVTSGITLAYDLTSKTWARWTLQTAGSPVTLTSLTQSGGIATAIKSNHGFADGEYVTHAGATPSGYNITKNITVVDANTYTFPVSSALSSPATGTITATGHSEGYFPFSFFTSCSGSNYVQHESNGKIYEIAHNHTDDDGAHIDMRVRLGKVDMGSIKSKTMGELTVIGDKISDTVIVRYSDDDYETWSKYRAVDMSIKQPRLRRLGSFKRRAIEYRYTGSSKLRVSGIEIEGN